MDSLHMVGLSTALERTEGAASILRQALVGHAPTAPGLSFTRAAIALALADRAQIDIAEYSARRWGRDSAPARIFKAAVPGDGLTSWADVADARQVAIEFLEYIRPMTIIGRLQGLRYVPRNTPYAAMVEGAVATWTGQGRAARVSRGAFARETMDARRLTALTVQSMELLTSHTPESEMLVRADLARAVVQASDFAFIDPANAGDGETPASVTEGQASTASSGDVGADVTAALAGFGGSLPTSSWVTHPAVAAQIGLTAGGRGVAADLGALGGTLAGLPVVTSESCPDDLLALVDASSITVYDGGIEARASTVATLELDDDPTGEGLSPVEGASRGVVSLFQADMVALMSVRHINWRVARPGAVYCVTGIDYGATSG
jgi:hypothetical protein